MKTPLKYALMALALVAFGYGCKTKQDDKEAIIGIWHVYSQTVNAIEMGDGKDWMEFKPEGKVDTRPRPGGYESGTYKLDDQNKILNLAGKNGDLDYKYFLNGDSLRLESSMPNSNFPIRIGCVRVEKYPITADQEPAEDLADTMGFEIDTIAPGELPPNAPPTSR